MNTAEFIEKAKAVHGDKYDYSKVEYVNSKTNVCIICPIHGEFWQNPYNHLKGKGCLKCAGKGVTTEEFIRKAKEIHGDKYDYSKVEYIKNSKPVCIICPIHGEFWQRPDLHMRGSGCPSCVHDSYTSTTEEFIRKAKEVHGDKYDYSKVKYTGCKDNVCIICPEHGEFWQIPGNHLKGKGCPKCARKRIADKKLKTKEWFFEKAKEIHGDKYDYSEVEYVDTRTKVHIICPIHGEFLQTPQAHLHGQGCPKCGGRVKLTTEEFIKKAKEIHGDKYDYSKVKYINANTKVCIICPKHGEFWQTPSGHLNSGGCQKCSGNEQRTTEEFVRKAREIHGDKYDYSKVEYINNNTKVCIICPEHGEFWQAPHCHLAGKGCSICNVGYTKQYKFNLLQEFKNEYEFSAFLENNDVNILYVILSAIEPKYDPLKRDIERALNNAGDINPIKALEDKYTSDTDDEDDSTDNDSVDDFTAATEATIDLDDDDAVDTVATVDKESEEESKPEPTIDDIIKNTEKEIKVINKIEHLLAPEIRKYIMDKFLNDKRRAWMLERENRK